MERLDLVTLRKMQPIALATDVDVAICAVWDFQSSTSFKSFAVCLNATIVLNLLVDGAGQVGDRRSSPLALMKGFCLGSI